MMNDGEMYDALHAFITERMGVNAPVVAATERVAAAAQDRPIFATIPDVELLEVGSWDAHTPDGRKATVTTEDLRAMVAAARDGHVRAAIVKLGHDSSLNDGAPALGRVDNLRVSADGMTLIGDLIGVPTWLADIAASAYPRRSAEWVQGYTTDTGRNFSSVLTAISLLGEAYPAVETLEDIRALYATQAPPLLPVTTEGGVTKASQEDRMPATIKARTEVDQIVRAFYNQSPDYSWVREVYVDPAELIIDDDNGGLYRLPYVIDGDTVTFGERTPVRVDYIDAPVAAPVAAEASSPRGRLVACFASKAATRQHNDQEEPAMTPIDLDALRQRFGLPEDADTDAINAAITAEQEQQDTTVAEVTDETEVEETTAVQDETVADTEPEPIAATTRVDDALERRLAAAEQELADRRDRETVQRRDSVISAAVQDGRLAPADRDEYRQLIDIDEERITRILTARESRVPLAARGEHRDDTVIAAEAALSDSPLLKPHQRQKLIDRGL